MSDPIHTTAASKLIRSMPDGEIEMVIYRGQKTSEQMWWWGDRVILWNEFAEKITEKLGITITKGDVLIALSQLSGIPKRTLRYYESNARFYDKKMRTTFEPLPFSLFYVAKSFGEDKWKEALVIASKYLTLYQRTPSPEWLQWRMSKEAPPILEMEHDLDRAASNLENKIGALEEEIGFEDFGEDDQVQVTGYTAHVFLKRLEDAINGINNQIEPLPLSLETKAEIEHATDDLIDALQRATQELREKA